MLFHIELKQVNLDTVQTVNARDLHAFLNVGRDFSTWIKNRIFEYGFVKNQDFVVFTKIGENPQKNAYQNNETSKCSFSQNGGKPKGGRPTVEYHITLDMAKFPQFAEI